MGVFTVHDALRAAAIDAGHELHLFEALGSPRSFEDLASRCRLRPTHRLLALIDALVALGALARDGDRITRGAIPPRSARPMIGGWGAIADVIRRDVPLAVDDADIARRYQHHLVTASAPAAREVADLLAGCVRSSDNARVVSPAGIGGSDPSGPRVIDIGGGAGAYTHAVLAGDPSAHVTLVDGPEVVAIAREGLAEFGDRVRFIADDARTLQVGRYRDGDERGIHVAIVANVLHLHGAEACAQICASAARVLAPSGVVAVVDLRRGTLEGELFALNMAVYTDKGRVYADSQIASWLEHAGFVDVTVRALASAPEMTAVFATRPELG